MWGKKFEALSVLFDDELWPVIPWTILYVTCWAKTRHIPHFIKIEIRPEISMLMFNCAAVMEAIGCLVPELWSETHRGHKTMMMNFDQSYPNQYYIAWNVPLRYVLCNFTLPSHSLTGWCFCWWSRSELRIAMSLRESCWRRLKESSHHEQQSSPATDSKCVFNSSIS